MKPRLAIQLRKSRLTSGTYREENFSFFALVCFLQHFRKSSYYLSLSQMSNVQNLDKIWENDECIQSTGCLALINSTLNPGHSNVL